jgi:hypothetical protein
MGVAAAPSERLAFVRHAISREGAPFHLLMKWLGIREDFVVAVGKHVPNAMLSVGGSFNQNEWGWIQTETVPGPVGHRKVTIRNQTLTESSSGSM